MGCRAGWDFDFPPRDIEGCAVTAAHPSSRLIGEDYCAFGLGLSMKLKIVLIYELSATNDRY